VARCNIRFFETIAGVIKSASAGERGRVAHPGLGRPQCFTTLICATNRAWGTAVHNWWRLPLKSLVLLGITAGAVLLGMAGAGADENGEGLALSSG